ncbi:pantoate--beta-alanine ligase [Falsihalocynthiibacter sp. SS001]|uniref:pantoate--beta-alanine ligase n=1 Tax=Falsihalocynthiibacter sp. SS001 TaxID=3349698 RepID=UPI0036D25FF2
MEICRSVAHIRTHVRGLRQAGHSVGLVPTMGALHDGHISLVRAAAERADKVVATIFVNPTQFGDSADLEKYPRTEDADIARLEAAGVSAVFMPQVSDIYAEDAETIVETTQLANMLHGIVRPGHYRGVSTVVTKLFNIVGPDVAAFGEKDYQQLQVIRKMVSDLHVPIEILPVPTMRESDGLAMSSRNVRLTPEDRKAAVILCQALDAAEKTVHNGTTVSDLAKSIRATIATEPRGTLEGLDIVAAESLAPLDGPINGPTAIMISVKFGDILLIDQRVVTPR